jgi:Zinc finger, C2H2 type
MKRKHVKNRFKCQQCKKICNSEYAMRSHKLELHLNEKKPVKKPVPRVKPPPQNRRISFGKYRCHFCDHESFQFAGIKQHILKHHLSVDEAIKCGECEQVFNHPDILKMHVRNLHNKKKELCNLCGKLLSDIFSLRQHIAYFHDKIKYRCKLCPLAVNHMSSLRKHMRKVHAIDTKIRCDICQTVFKTVSLLKVHIYSCHLIVASLNRATCDICKSEFENDMKLELHMKVAHPKVTRKRQACVACNANFDKVWQLTEHLQQHAGVFACPGKECEKVFPTHNALACHHYHAHKTREINCHCCEYVTKSVADLCRHFETHRNEVVSQPG